MPASKKLSKNEALEQVVHDAVFTLCQLNLKAREHYDCVDHQSFSPEYVHKSGGSMIHDSEYDEDALQDAFDEFMERNTKLQNIVKKPLARNNPYRVLREMTEQMELYLDIFEQDYIFREALWCGGSLGISDEVREACDEADARMTKMETKMRQLDKRVRRAFEKVEKLEQQKEPAPKSVVSPKEKRANKTKQLSVA